MSELYHNDMTREALPSSEQAPGNTLNTLAANVHRNKEILATSELGPQLVAAYEAALRLWPEVGSTIIVPLGEEYPTTLAAAMPLWSPRNTTGQHTVLFRTHNAETAMAKSEAVLNAIPKGRELVAESFCLSPEELTPHMDHVAMFLHELSHTKEFQEFSPGAFMERKKAERLAMPLGPMPVSRFVTPGSTQYEWFVQNADALARKHGVEDPREVLTLQLQTYLNTSSERYANDHAAQALSVMNSAMRASLT